MTANTIDLPKLKFSKANTKLEKLADVPELESWLNVNGRKRKIYSFDLLSGWSCPFADQCLSKVIQINGKRQIKDGPNTEFRCFSASQEALFADTYAARKHNFDSVRAAVRWAEESAAELWAAGRVDCSERQAAIELVATYLNANLPRNAGIVRVHVAGDFFSEIYLLAWFRVAEIRPDVLFYAYTKSLRYWVDNRDRQPANFTLTASRGGRLDALISEFNLREAVVILHPEEANGLEIDHDDSHAARPDLAGQSFALLIHGQQPAGSESAAAIQRLKREGVEYAYSK